MSDTLFSLNRVSKFYDDRCVLTVDELDVKRGEVLAIVGPSGAGKSTLLRLLNFLEPPTTGQIAFDGKVYDEARLPSIDVQRRVTTVFQRPLLLKRSVQANVRYGLRLRGERNAQTAVEDVLAQVGMGEMAKQHARTLSGGEAQRVALARAMILRPDVLLMDEPTANLDPYNVKLIEGVVRQLNVRDGTTIVIVTHNIFQARRLAQRAAFLLDGDLVEVSDATTFFESPHDERTAAFVSGEMAY
ncbi:MAG: phosphate ABC transporter ATP-binding protein [Chloroflexota bacterium]